MKKVIQIQRAKTSYVTVDGKTVGKIDSGLVVLLGVANEDTDEDFKYLVTKIPTLRIFEDEDDEVGKMNKSLIKMEVFSLFLNLRFLEIREKVEALVLFIQQNLILPIAII